ncbi:MAG: M23 family metallopeptidase [Oscillospiraceae bacterium]|nr:M23 family metallopeptidase [Oscillospiraceae bacterium]
MKKQKKIFITVVGLLLVTSIISYIVVVLNYISASNVEKADYIKWVQFDVPYSALQKAMKIDISSQTEEVKIDWIELLSYLSAKYYGKWGSYKPSDMDEVSARLKSGEKMENLAEGLTYYNFYLEAYSAVLEEFLGSYTRYEMGEQGNIIKKEGYGLKVYSPIAKGYSYSHYDDFGVSRSYGFTRTHKGNDLVGSVGTPIIAVEGGYVEHLGWNQYGGWRVGIRSEDKKRYYYYAHLRRDHPFHLDIKEGDYVSAGDVIGYLGMTGYSTRENVNGMTIPHLHFGLQLIFDESQSEGINQIWVDVYDIVKLLYLNRTSVEKNLDTKDYYSYSQLNIG